MLEILEGFVTVLFEDWVEGSVAFSLDGCMRLKVEGLVVSLDSEPSLFIFSLYFLSDCDDALTSSSLEGSLLSSSSKSS